MAINLFNIIRQGGRFENWLLLLRTVMAARLVLRHLEGHRVKPDIASSIRAAEEICLSSKTGWTIRQPHLIASAAHLITRIPITWGECVQQSLITYRLLNGYGIPCQICFGVSLANPAADGHAWIRTIHPEDQHLAGGAEPLDRFQIVYISPRQQAAAQRSDQLTPGESVMED